MIKHDSKYAIIEVNSDKSLIKHIWKSSSSEMSEQEFKLEMEELAKVFQSYPDMCVLVDQRNFFFVVPLKLQKWVDENVNRLLLDGDCRKIVFVVPPDMMTKLSVSHVFESKYSKQLNVRFFDTEQEAISWLGVI